MKIIKKVMYILFIMILTLIVANSKVFGSNAVSSLEEKEGVVVLGTYKKIENVTVQKEVQITEEMKEFYDLNGLEYYTKEEEIKLWFVTLYTYEYYYIYEEYSIPTAREKVVLKNDINSLIYVVNLLENFAFDYISSQENYEQGDEILNRDITNLVLGYIRSFNDEYVNSYFESFIPTWQFTAGIVNRNFIEYVKEHDNSPFTISDYFACFCEPKYYNSAYHGERTYPDDFTNIFLIDPLNDYENNNEIDLIHMMASLDGIYDYTYDLVDVSDIVTYIKELAGWAGDL